MPLHDEHLTWMVPCRRACVKRRLPYRDLLEKWGVCLNHYRAQMTRWYGLTDTQLTSGLQDLAARIALLDPSRPATFARTGTGTTTGNALNLREMPVRLWKGPLRVLLEKRASGAENPGDAPPLVTQITYHDQTLSLELSEAQREVLNTAAEFLMGDVVEFPLARFLVQCGKSNYEGITFNPAGSFFFGDTLCQNGQPRDPDGEPLLHDNLIAMRFQLLTGMLRGAFYSLDRVYTRNTSRATQATDPDQSALNVYARGIAYGATWLNPTNHLAEGYWSGAANGLGFGTAHDLPDNLPTPRSLATLAGDADPPVTPGISCSPCSLMLCSFMLNLNDWGYSSVQTEFTPVAPNPRATSRRAQEGWDPRNSIYWGKIDENSVPESEMLGENNSERQTAREQIDRRISEVLADLGEPRPLTWNSIQDSELTGLEQGRREIAQARRDGDPTAVLTSVNRALGQVLRPGRDDDQERQRATQRGLLRSVHRLVFERMVSVRERIVALMQDQAAWDRAELAPLDVELPEDWPTGTHADDQDCTDGHGLSPARIRRLRESLQNMKRELQSGSAYRDMLAVLHDINVFSLSSHELSIVKVYPFHELMERSALPISGRMAAYDPLSGVEDFPAESTLAAQLFFLEASGHLSWYLRPSGARVQACGIQPFHWGRIDDNRMHVQHESDGLHFAANPEGSDARRVAAIWRMHDQVLRSVYPRNEHSVQPSPADPEFKAFRILKLRGSGARRSVNGPLDDDAEALFAERALPFPTFAYATAHGNYPRASSVRPCYATALQEVQQALERGVANPNHREAHENFQREISRGGGPGGAGGGTG